MKPNQTLDARRLLCPMPVIKTQNLVNTLQPGERISVIATDPGTLEDIPTWCRINGHTVVSIEEKNKDIIFTIEVGEN